MPILICICTWGCITIYHFWLQLPLTQDFPLCHLHLQDLACLLSSGTNITKSACSAQKKVRSGTPGHQTKQHCSHASCAQYL